MYILFRIQYSENIIYWPRACLTMRPVRAMKSVSKAKLALRKGWLNGDTVCGSVSTDTRMALGAKFTADAVVWRVDPVNVDFHISSSVWVTTSSLPKSNNRCVISTWTTAVHPKNIRYLNEFVCHWIFRTRCHWIFWGTVNRTFEMHDHVILYCTWILFT